MRMGVVACALWLAAGTAAAHIDTLKQIKDSDAITFGVRDASGALSFTLGPGRYTGFHVDVCERIVTDIKKALQLDQLTVNYQLVAPQNRILLVQNGTVDVECGTTTNNTVRQKDVAFAPTLYVERVRIAVRSDPRSDAAFKQLVDRSVIALARSGEVATPYDKWFVQPIPPQELRVGLPANALTQAAWASPSDKPMEACEAR